ncbi:MAG: endonuclease MutS2 [Sorangium cellulosum]|nr:MAG: endonuclease MutS2 [Sorangium cellulosum]
MSSTNSGAWLTTACSNKTRSDVEWDRLLEALAMRAPGPLGKRCAKRLRFCSSREAVVRALAEVREAFELHCCSEPLPTGAAPIVREQIERLRAGGVLTSEELLDAALLLSCARALRRFLSVHQKQAPLLTQACATDPSLDQVADEIRYCFESDGTLSDRASPRLRELRQERQSARQRLLNKLDDIMQRYGATLQDEYYTEREGRFVLPVRSDSHERFNGIVHATSASGQTLFMEPRSVIPLGNQLKMVNAEIEREEAAVYRRLSAALADVVESFAGAESALAHAELRVASAALAVDLNLAFPSLSTEAELDLVQARHPLLMLDGTNVVPCDVCVQSGRALVISGPNAGGKTVVLKTLGLIALLLRAGLPIPCDPKSKVGLFENVATDMGDEQSIAKNLSTFSAHVRNLASILDLTNRRTLVLLDEIATGTDPRQGEALAAGVLDGMCARGGAVACTTHYEGLKSLALGDQRFSNAAVGFDMSTMSPTFRLAMGVPGASSALAIAKRFGMPSSVLQRAERYLGVEEKGFNELVAKLNDERRALELARDAAERETRGLQNKRRDVELELDRLRNRERTMISEQTQSLLLAVQRARDDLRAAQQRLRAKKMTQETLKESAQIIESVASKVALGGALEPPDHSTSSDSMTPLSRNKLKPGTMVYVPRLHDNARIVDILNRGQVRVALGAVKVIVALEDLRMVHNAQSAAPIPKQHSRNHSAVVFDAASDPNLPIQTADNQCDLRGLRVDEAIGMAEQFLDRCLNHGLRVAFLIHGRGSGALRNAIREALFTSHYVKHFRPGERNEGGNGVTVVWLN